MNPFLEFITVLILPPLGAIVIAGAATGIGSILMQPFQKGQKVHLVESFALGTIAVSVVTMIWGFLGWMGPNGRWSLALLMLLLGVTGWIITKPDTPLLMRSFRNRSILVIMILIVVGVLPRIFLSPLAPPIAPESCEITLPAAYSLLETGDISFQPDIKFNSFPRYAEFLFAWAVAYTPSTTAQCLNFICFLFTLLGVIRLGRETFSVKIGWLAALILALMAAVRELAVIASAELWLMFYFLIALLTGVQAVKTQNPRKLILAGIFIGAAAGVRFTGIIAGMSLVISLAAIYGWHMPKSKPFEREDFFSLILMAFFVGLPWYIVNVIWFRNPLYPFFSTFFSPQMGTYDNYGPECMVTPVWYYQKYTIWGLLENAALWKYLVQELWIAWAVIPAAILYWRENPFMRLIGTCGVLTWLYWLTLGSGIIYNIFFIYLAPLSAVAISHMLVNFYIMPRADQNGRMFRFACWVLLIVWIGITGLLTVDDRPPVTEITKQAYLSNNLDSYSLIQAANDVIPEGSIGVGIMCGDARLYADFTLFGGDDIGWANHYVLSEYSSNPGNLARLLRDRYNASFLIVNETAMTDPDSGYIVEVHLPTDREDFHDFFRVVVRVGGGVVYYIPEIRPESGF